MIFFVVNRLSGVLRLSLSRYLVLQYEDGNCSNLGFPSVSCLLSRRSALPRNVFPSKPYLDLQRRFKITNCKTKVYSE